MPIVARENVAMLAVLRDATVCAEPVAWWLGQAGFLVCSGSARLVVDPYLSDSLACKYRGARFPHVRMMPPPVAPGELTPLDAVFCTHAHSDHMDPETLGVLAKNNAKCRFVVPRAEVAVAQSRGIPLSQMVAVDAGESGSTASGVGWRALASAHEGLSVDEAGNHRFLGYLLELGGLTVYHSGDCVPYSGLAETLRRHDVDVAILPVNGRDADRSAAGILGNFTFDEAVRLCRDAQIPSMLACHFGMFDFNTVHEARLDRQMALVAEPPQCVRPRVGTAYVLQPSLHPAKRRPEVERRSHSQGTTP